MKRIEVCNDGGKDGENQMDGWITRWMDNQMDG